MLINICGRTTSIISRRHADNDSIKSFLQTLALAYPSLSTAHTHTNSAQLSVKDLRLACPTVVARCQACLKAS